MPPEKCFLVKIADPKVLPEVYVVPSGALDALIYQSPKGRRVVPLSRMHQDGQHFKDQWSLLEHLKIPPNSQ